MEEVLIIAAALEVQDPRDRRSISRARRTRHEQFADMRSDFLHTSLWSFYHEQKQKLSHNKLRKACKQNFLNYVRMREWIDVHHQLKRMVQELKGVCKAGNWHSADELPDAKADAIHRALLTGLLSNIANKGDGFEYTGSVDETAPLARVFTVRRQPKWVVAAELVETTRRYARTVGRIQPGMIEPIAGHLVKKTHSDPRWVRETGSAMCSEKVSLYGLVLVQARPVPVARVNPQEARQMFIQRALVEGEWDCDLPFYKYNRELLEQAKSLEAKARRHGLVAADDVRYVFYDERLPEAVVDGATFKKWHKQTSRDSPKLLLMDLPMLLAGKAEDVTEYAFPDRMKVEQSAHKIDYTFDPGDERDGLTSRCLAKQLVNSAVGWAGLYRACWRASSSR